MDEEEFGMPITFKKISFTPRRESAASLLGKRLREEEESDLEFKADILLQSKHFRPVPCEV
jgi:hypothetical protein